MNIARIEAGDGTRLALHRLGPPAGHPVLLVPGAFSDHRFWLGTRGTGFGLALAECGHSVWVLDPRGHGGSERPASRNHWGFRDWVVHDVPAAIRAVTGDGRRVAIVGHSAGGAAVLSAAAATPALVPLIAGIAAIATPAPATDRWRRSGARLARLISHALGRFPAQMLRLGGEDEIGGVMAEWMGWNVAGSWRWPGGPDLISEISPAPFPVLIAAGSGDRLFAPPEVCRDLALRLNARFLEFGRRTGFSEDFTHPGLVVGRAAREEVWPVILDWIATVTA